MISYKNFITQKTRLKSGQGIKPVYTHSMLFDFQNYLVDWSLHKGRSAIFADCGLGKTPIQLTWADNIVRSTNGNILILTPLAVTAQTIRESVKFGIEAKKSRDGKALGKITVTNYEKLHLFNKDDFVGIVCDESSILKNYAGKTRAAIIEFCKQIPYRLLCTATPAPNDYMELGNTCEALGVMRRVEMLSTYFTHDSENTGKWILKGHAHAPFWKFMASWARAMQFPSDFGFDDDGFILPELKINQITIESKPTEGRLIAIDAVSLSDQRKERRETLVERCNTAAKIANKNNKPFLAWCSLNVESKLLTKEIDGAVELTGSDSDEAKEEKMKAFSSGQIRCLVTKPKIAGFGLNWQHCSQMSFFPSHSYEQYYQALRRCWRFGQKETVNVTIVTSEAESRVLANMKRKEKQSANMFRQLVKHMGGLVDSDKNNYKPEKKMEIPSWL